MKPVKKKVRVKDRQTLNITSKQQVQVNTVINHHFTLH